MLRAPARFDAYRDLARPKPIDVRVIHHRSKGEVAVLSAIAVLLFLHFIDVHVNVEYEDLTRKKK